MRVGKYIKSATRRLTFIVLLGGYMLLALKVTNVLYNKNGPTVSEAVQERGFVLIFVLYCLTLSLYLNVPIIFFSVLGMIIFSPFYKVGKNKTTINDPFICFRVVTRGLYPKLVQDVTKMNLQICRNAGLQNFKFEIVTDMSLNIQTSNYVREVHVPREYKTPNSSLFKARALHYCLDQTVNMLARDDWIVHLDEETLLTEDALNGIIKFVSRPDSNIGQGVITYGACGIENWLTTLLDGMRVSIDYGLYRFALQFLHRPVFGFKGSFIVVKMAVENEIGFDFGPQESIAEDLRFALAAWSKGYRFDFVDGAMKEKSTFSISDYIKQRKRWFVGHFHIVWGNSLPLYYKWALLPMHICNMFLWTNVLNTFISFFIEIPLAKWQLCLYCLLTFHVLFMFLFGNFMSLCQSRYSLVARVIISFLSQFLFPVLGVLEAYACLKGFFERNYIKFEVVQKETNCKENERIILIDNV